MEKKPNTPTAGRALRQWFKHTLFAGLAILVPLALTFYILNLIISTADALINHLPESILPPTVWRLPGTGLLASVLIALIAGVIARNVIGSYVVQAFNRLVERIPLIASIYKLLRQLSETLLSTDAKKGFKTAVLVEWPRRDCWTIAFVASEVSGTIAKELGATPSSPYLNLFIPATPNPTSGFFLMVRADDVKPLRLSVEAAFKVIISGGTLPADGINESQLIQSP